MFNPDFRDMLCGLSAAKVDYLLVGGYAMACHGHPRSTGDIDLWVRSDPETALRVFRTLEEFGAPMHDLKVEDLASPDVVFQIGVEPSRIDILTSIAGVTFEEAWPRRTQFVIDGIPIDVIGRDDLIANKRTAGRLKDLADVETLEQSRHSDSH